MLLSGWQTITDQNGADRPETSLAGASERVEDEYKYIIGIDFGTTYSAVAYTKIGEIDSSGRPVINDIRGWPGGQAKEIPTRSFYKDGELFQWGYKDVRPKDGENVEEITMYKLLLCENKYANVPPLPQKLNITKVIADYLRELYGHTCKRLRDNYGEIDESKWRFCLTVPAVWTEKAKIIMRDAAIQAGIVDVSDPQNRLLLVSEPEAAALYCNVNLAADELKHGDTFLICDAGGGTVDLAAYRINNEPEDEKYLIEIAAGDGGLCGSVNLDQRFKKYVIDQVKTLVDPALTKYELKKIVTEFITEQKRSIMYEDEITVEPPHRFSKSCLTIPTKEVFRVIFDPVVEKVLDLIEAQCKGVGKLDTMFLVGGFVQSDYLLGKIQERFRNKVKILRPDVSAVAIVWGAIYMCLKPLSVKKRVIRRTYGYQCALKYDKDADIGRPTVYVAGVPYCNGRFRTYALKGEVQNIDYSVSEKFSGYYHVKKQPIRLFAYDGDSEKIPRYTDDETVQETIQFDIIMPELQDKKPDDIIEIMVEFFLYQTEIKLKTTIGHSVKFYTGLYPRDKGSLSSHAQKTELGIMGNIPETDL